MRFLRRRVAAACIAVASLPAPAGAPAAADPHAVPARVHAGRVQAAAAADEALHGAPPRVAAPTQPAVPIGQGLPATPPGDATATVAPARAAPVGRADDAARGVQTVDAASAARGALTVDAASAARGALTVDAASAAPGAHRGDAPRSAPGARPADVTRPAPAAHPGDATRAAPSAHQADATRAAPGTAASTATAAARTPAPRAPAPPASATAASTGAPGRTACIDETAPVAAGTTEPAVPAPEPRAELSNLVRDAIARSQSVGAARLLADAALDDIDEARAAKSLTASAGGGVGPGGTLINGVREVQAIQLRASLNVGQLLYDGGRTDKLVDWRSQLAEAARYGQLSQQEQLAASTVALALERSRYRQHVQVYAQLVRKMACLVEALDTIVRADRGRASELVQARKSLQQAEIAQAQAVSQVRQSEIRLRRLVGDGLPGTEGLSTVLLQVPPLDELQADVERAADLAQLAAQAAAADRYADAAAAAARPQLSWSFGGNAAAGAGGNAVNTKSGSFAVGVNVNIPIVNPGVQPATDAARKRARAALLQRSDAVEARRFRVAEVHEQVQSSFDRARRVGAVLRDSEQVRNFTLQQWQQLGRRSLFDVIGAESDHYNLRVAYINALLDGQQLNAVLLSLGRGVGEWLR